MRGMLTVYRVVFDDDTLGYETRNVIASLEGGTTEYIEHYSRNNPTFHFDKEELLTDKVVKSRRGDTEPQAEQEEEQN